MLLKLWAIPGVAATAALVGACIVRRPWARRILFAVAITLVIPAPIFSPDGGAIVPLGMLLMPAEAFPKAIFLMAIPVVILSGAFWFMGWAFGLLKKRMKGRGQSATSPYSEPAARSSQGGVAPLTQRR